MNSRQQYTMAYGQNAPSCDLLTLLWFAMYQIGGQLYWCNYGSIWKTTTDKLCCVGDMMQWCKRTLVNKTWGRGKGDSKTITDETESIEVHRHLYNVSAHWWKGWGCICLPWFSEWNLQETCMSRANAGIHYACNHKAKKQNKTKQKKALF